MDEEIEKLKEQIRDLNETLKRVSEIQQQQQEKQNVQAETTTKAEESSSSGGGISGFIGDIIEKSIDKGMTSILSSFKNAFDGITKSIQESAQAQYKSQFSAPKEELQKWEQMMSRSGFDVTDDDRKRMFELFQSGQMRMREEQKEHEQYFSGSGLVGGVERSFFGGDAPISDAFTRGRHQLGDMWADYFTWGFQQQQKRQNEQVQAFKTNGE